MADICISSRLAEHFFSSELWLSVRPHPCSQRRASRWRVGKNRKPSPAWHLLPASEIHWAGARLCKISSVGAGRAVGEGRAVGAGEAVGAGKAVGAGRGCGSRKEWWEQEWAVRAGRGGGSRKGGVARGGARRQGGGGQEGLRQAQAG